MMKVGKTIEMYAYPKHLILSLTTKMLAYLLNIQLYLFIFIKKPFIGLRYSLFAHFTASTSLYSLFRSCESGTLMQL